MTLLAIDTCLGACSAALLRDGQVLAARAEPMARGHQERLAPLVRDLAVEAGVDFKNLFEIAVVVGPGSFTGLRVGLAFAKGLGQALSIPVIGVGALEALAAGVVADGVVFAAIDAKRGQVYIQAFEAGEPLMAPDALLVETAAARLPELAAGRTVTLVGSGAGLLAEVAPGATVIAADYPDPVAVARLAAGRQPTPPRPLYLRAPDARLPGGVLPP